MRTRPSSVHTVVRHGMLGAVLALTLAACLAGAQKREDSLIRGVNETNADLRWQRWEHVANVMVPEEGRLFMQRVADLNDELAMADHEVTQVEIGAGSNSATVTVIFEWYSKRNPVMKKTTVTQGWVFENGRWMLKTQKRLRGDRLALIVEPLKTDGGADGGADGRASDAAPMP